MKDRKPVYSGTTVSTVRRDDRLCGKTEPGVSFCPCYYASYNNRLYADL